jgi:hypothetical protein
MVGPPIRRAGARPAKTKSDATVGRILAAARRHRGLTLAAVAAELKIPERHLAALESGDVSIFAADVYARGAFLRYATYLGVASETTQRAFLRALSGVREHVPLRVHRPRPVLAALMTGRWVIAGVLLLIALGVGTYVAWQVESFVRLPALSLVEPTSGVAGGEAITIRGQAALDAEVQVNGEAALLDQAGTFSVPLRLHPGINVVHLEATNAAGRTATVTRTILLPRPNSSMVK